MAGSFAIATSPMTYVLIETLPRDSRIYVVEFYVEVIGDVTWWLLRPDTPGNVTSLRGIQKVDVSGENLVIGLNEVSIDSRYNNFLDRPSQRASHS